MKKFIFTSFITFSSIAGLQAASLPQQTYQNPNSQASNNSAVINVTTNSFQQLLANTQKPIVLVFSASWCKPCQTMKPIIEEIAREIPEVTFLRADFDANPELVQNFRVDSIPAVLFIRKDGYIVDRSIGFTTKQQLKDKIQAFTASQQN